MSTNQKSFAEPERIVQSFDLQKGDHVADFGAGHGFFVIPIARRVGGDGKVYAIDIQRNVLEVIRSKAKLEHLLNIEFIWADLELPNGSKLKNAFLDFVLISNSLFQVENKLTYFFESARILSETGRLAVIEWDDTPTPLGPPLSHRVKKNTVRELALRAGFSLDREFEAGSHHYGLLFYKNVPEQKKNLEMNPKK